MKTKKGKILIIITVVSFIALMLAACDYDTSQDESTAPDRKNRQKKKNMYTATMHPTTKTMKTIPTMTLTLTTTSLMLAIQQKIIVISFTYQNMTGFARHQPDVSDSGIMPLFFLLILCGSCVSKSS